MPRRTTKTTKQRKSPASTKPAEARPLSAIVPAATLERCRVRLGLDTLATRGIDGLDFAEHSAASIVDAVELAYRAGLEDAGKPKRSTPAGTRRAVLQLRNEVDRARKALAEISAALDAELGRGEDPGHEWSAFATAAEVRRRLRDLVAFVRNVDPENVEL